MIVDKSRFLAGFSMLSRDKQNEFMEKIRRGIALDLIFLLFIAALFTIELMCDHFDFFLLILPLPIVALLAFEIVILRCMLTVQKQSQPPSPKAVNVSDANPNIAAAIERVKNWAEMHGRQCGTADELIARTKEMERAGNLTQYWAQAILRFCGQ